MNENELEIYAYSSYNLYHNNISKTMNVIVYTQ